MIAIEYGNVLKEIRNAAAVLAIGEMEEVNIQTRRYRFVIRAITEEYFVVLALDRDGNLGKGRYVLRRDNELLREALQ
jgi:predicted regulator of Ras-like GTPase activity (Roadblock/LC7/MglB family)